MPFMNYNQLQDKQDPNVHTWLHISFHNILNHARRKTCHSHTFLPMTKNVLKKTLIQNYVKQIDENGWKYKAHGSCSSKVSIQPKHRHTGERSRKKKHCRNTRLASVNDLSLGQTPGHLTFLKNFFQIPGYVSSLDGQMPHQPALQETSNPPATIQKIPIRQTVYSNVNILLSTTEISKASESWGFFVSIKLFILEISLARRNVIFKAKRK